MANCLMERLILENLVMRSPVPKPVEIAQLTAEYAKAKERHSRILDRIANGESLLVLGASQSLDELLDLQWELIKMHMGLSER